MVRLKNILSEVTKERAAEEYLSMLVKGTEWEDHVFIAGGYVRDQLLGKDAKDIDLVVALPEGGVKFAEWATRKIGNHSAGNPTIFPKFGTAKFTLRGVTHLGIDLSEIDVEAVMTRSEKYTPGSRKPDIAFGDLKVDVERRDATVNSLLKKLSTGEILDLTGRGRDDLTNGVLRTPLDPDVTFQDDPLRILRMIRMSAKYNWKIPIDILRSIRRNSAKLGEISRERVQAEVDKMLMTGHAGKALRLIKILKLAPYVFPSIDAVTDECLIDVDRRPVDLPLRLAAVFYSLPRAGEVAEKELRNTKYDTATIQMVKTILDNYRGVSDGINDPMQFRTLVSSIGENKATQVVRFLAGDAKNEASAMLQQQIQLMRANPLPVTGQDLISLGMKSGPALGAALKAIKGEYIKDPKTPTERYLSIAKQFI